MSQRDKLLVKILLGTSDANIPFEPLCQLLCALDFDERIRGSNHIFSKEGIEEILNLQPKQGTDFSGDVKRRSGSRIFSANQVLLLAIFRGFFD